MSGLNSESFGHEKSFLVSKGASAGLCASPRLERSCDSCRFDEGDENLSPNGLFLRETTPEAEEAISLPLGSWSKPYSPRSNPFGERPSQKDTRGQKLHSPLEHEQQPLWRSCCRRNGRYSAQHHASKACHLPAHTPAMYLLQTLSCAAVRQKLLKPLCCLWRRQSGKRGRKMAVNTSQPAGSEVQLGCCGPH